MNSIVFVVLLASLAVFAAGADNTTTTSNLSKLLSSVKSTRDAAADSAIVEAFLLNCPGALTLHQNCLTENNYNPYPGAGQETCEMARLELTCGERSFLASTACAGQQEAINAVRRLQPVIEAFCAALGAATSVVATGFLTVLLMSFVNLLH